MRILFFDDSVSRHDFFCLKKHERHHCVQTCQHGPEYTVDHVYTAAQALVLLRKHTYDVIQLDHDMFLSKDASPDNNGMTVARFLANQEGIDFHGPVIQIHSWNVEESEVMYALLRSAGWDVHLAPFPVA